MEAKECKQLCCALAPGQSLRRCVWLWLVVQPSSQCLPLKLAFSGWFATMPKPQRNSTADFASPYDVVKATSIRHCMQAGHTEMMLYWLKGEALAQRTLQKRQAFLGFLSFP